MQHDNKPTMSKDTQLEIAQILGEFYKMQVRTWRKIISGLVNGRKAGAMEHAHIILEAIEASSQQLITDRDAVKIFNALASEEKI